MSTTMTSIKERPILFSTPMVRAILAGEKTQTRRIVKDPPKFAVGRVEVSDGYASFLSAAVESSSYRFWSYDHYESRRKGQSMQQAGMPCPYGAPGDRLWVRESWAPCIGGPCEPGNPVLYRADAEPIYDQLTWKPLIFMPRWASRITLEVTDVRVERVQDISEADARAEGVEPEREASCVGGLDLRGWSYVAGFRRVWESINGEDSWATNPWVWCLTFNRVEDQR